MDLEAGKIFAGFAVILALAGLASASGYLRSQNGSVVLQPQDNQVLPSSDNSVDLGGPGSRWNEVYANYVYAGASNSSAGGFRLKNSSGDNVFHWVYHEPTKTMYLAQTGVSEIMTFQQGDSALKFYKTLAPSTDIGYNLGSPSNRWASVYASYLRANAVGPIDNSFYVDNYWGTGDTSFIMQSPAAYSVLLEFRQGANASRRGFFRFEPVSSGRRGMILDVVGDGDKRLIPSSDGSYDLGSSGLRWRNVNLFGLLNFGSPAGNKIQLYDTGNNYKFLVSLVLNGYEYITRFGAPGAYGAEIFQFGTISTADGVTFTPILSIRGDRNIVSNASIAPAIDNAYDSGSSTKAWRTVYAYTYVDRTPFKSSAELKAKYNRTALQLIKGINADRDGNLDHASLPDFVRVNMPSASTEDGGKMVAAGSLGKEYGRDIGSQLSLNTVGVQELDDKVSVLEKRIAELERKLNSTKR